METRIRLIGALIVACGLALCYGASELWQAARLAGEAESSAAGSLLRIVGACLAAVLGAGNVAAGLVVALRKTARD